MKHESVFWRTIFRLQLCLACGWALTAAARPPLPMDSAEDRQILASFLSHVPTLLKGITPEAMARIEEGEMICWSVCPLLRMPLLAYRLSGDTRHLDTFTQATDALLTRLRKGPDGYLGFRGLPLDGFRDAANPKAQCDVNITEFEVTHILCDFVAIVREEPELKDRYGAAATRYLALAEHDLAGKKWEARQEYVDLGRQGAIFRMARECGPQRSLLTDPNNKQSKMCRALLALYRVTGKDEYFRKAVKLGVRYKHTVRLVGDRYLWHYWDPAGDWDRTPGNPRNWRHWIGAEHRGGYHGLTLAMAEALYDHGVVFDKTDMERFTRTQAQVCWNGSLENPVFLNVEGHPGKEPAQRTFMAPALARFEPKLYEYFYGPRATRAHLARGGASWSGMGAKYEYLGGKYLLPRSAEPQQIKFREQFRRQPENAAFLKDMAFSVTDEKRE